MDTANWRRQFLVTSAIAGSGLVLTLAATKLLQACSGVNNIAIVKRAAKDEEIRYWATMLAKA